MYSSILNTEGLFGLSGNNAIRWVNIISQVFSIMFYFQGIFNSFELSGTFYKISKHLTEKMNSLAEFTSICSELIHELWNTDISNIFFDIKSMLQRPFACDFTPTPFSLISNFGKQLKAFKQLDLDSLRHMIHKINILDALYTLRSSKILMGANYVEYSKGTTPTLTTSHIFHPCIPLDKVVKNDISVGSELYKNAIITGPNAGGKSTFIKSILVNTIFAQTIGIVMSSSFVFTPFHMIHSQINLPDTKGKESLFEAEMYRCKNILDMLKESPNRKLLIVMDEIFNSTNPVEGIAGAFAIVKKIAEYPNAILIFTTHYSYLTKLQKQTKKFVNYKMNISREDNNIIYHYKLEKGFSKQYIALELLRLNGFDSDLIDDAIRIKNKFV